MGILFCGRSDRRNPKKLDVEPVGTGLTGGEPMGRVAISSLDRPGQVILEQLWEIKGNKGIKMNSARSVSLTAAHPEFLPPRTWKRIMIPYRLKIDGGATIVPALQRQGLVAGICVTKGGQVLVNIWNSHKEPIYLTPKTVLVNILGCNVFLKEFGKNIRALMPRSASTKGITPEDIEIEVRRRFPGVGDLSSHPINEKMAHLRVRRDEVSMREPKEWGIRTQYAVENVADRRLIEKQLQDYVQRGYLREVSAGEKVYLSPLLPIRKPNGTFRFTNDLRKLNSYFSKVGTSQVDVWRKLWEIDASWRYFMEIDLKDGFFNLPIDRDLSSLFGFTFGQKRYAWVRLPQGWMWSSPIFCERIAEILKPIPGRAPQYCDNVLVGAATPVELMTKALKVFEVFNDYGLKVNFDKVKWMSNKLSFLGWEIEGGLMSLRGYLRKKKGQLGKVRSVHDLERVIGIISYARRVIKGTEIILSPLRADLRVLKNGPCSDEWFLQLDKHIEEAFLRVHSNTVDLSVPGVDPIEFHLETDWSKGFAGYMLFAILSDGRKCLVDLGSKAGVHGASSYLGELTAIVWACKQTKAYRGSIPLTIFSDNHGIYDKERKRILVDDDYRSFRRWGWLLANEPGFSLTFLPGEKNRGADFLSRKGKKVRALGTSSLIFDAEVWIPGEGEYFKKTHGKPSSYGVHCNAIGEMLPEAEMRNLVWREHLKAHLGAWKVYKALRRQGYRIPMKFVRRELAVCEICAHFKEERPRSEWHPLLYSRIPGEIIYADVCGPLPPGIGGIQYIHCVIDSATSMADATKIRILQAQNVVCGLDQWIRKYGRPKVIVTDNVSYYQGRKVRDWCKKHNVQHRFCAPRRHQSVGLIERFIRSLKDRLRRLAFAEGTHWQNHVNRAVDSLNQAVHRTMGYSPKELWEGTDEMRRKAHERRDKWRGQENRYLRHKIRPYKFRIGQMVLVRDYESWKLNRLAVRWKGPFKLVERISDTMWRAVDPKGVNKKASWAVMKFHQDQMQPLYERRHG